MAPVQAQGQAAAQGGTDRGLGSRRGQLAAAQGHLEPLALLLLLQLLKLTVAVGLAGGRLGFKPLELGQNSCAAGDPTFAGAGQTDRRYGRPPASQQPAASPGRRQGHHGGEMQAVG